jgi:hypothetical protein
VSADNRYRLFVNGAEVARYSRPGVITPDHTMRTKNWPLVLPAPKASKLDDFKRAAAQAAEKFATHYKDYFARNNARVGGAKKMLDPLPRVVLVQGLGLFGLGHSKQDAIIAADIAEAWVEGVTDAEAIGTFKSISEADMFDCEYWPLELAKLGAAREKPLAGQIAVITGAGGAIGSATAKAFAAAGAEVALLDVNFAAAFEQAQAIGGRVVPVLCAVTNGTVSVAFQQVVYLRRCRHLVSNAGGRGRKKSVVDEKILRESFELNSYGLSGAQAAEDHAGAGYRRMLVVQRLQAGGQSGAEFWALWFAEAATLFLVRQYAVDYGAVASAPMR